MYNIFYKCFNCIIYNNLFITLKVAGKSPQQQASYPFARSTSTSRFTTDFPVLQEKSSPYSNGLYGSASTTHTSPRFPPIGTFAPPMETNNVFSSGGDNQMNNYSNGSNSSYNENSNMGTRETGIIEKLLVSIMLIRIKTILLILIKTNP